MTTYRINFSALFDRQLKKLCRKDKVLFERLKKKLKELVKNPEHYKPLKNDLKGMRRVHVDPFVIIFEIEDDYITIHYVKHHDKAY